MITHHLSHLAELALSLGVFIHSAKERGGEGEGGEVNGNTVNECTRVNRWRREAVLRLDQRTEHGIA